MVSVLLSKIESISSVCNYDYFMVKSSFMTDEMKRVNCHRCQGEKNHEKIKKIQHCTSISKLPIFPTDEFNYYTCAGNFRLGNWSNILMLCDFFSKGINPYGGTLAETPNKLVEISNLVHNFKVDKQIKDQKEWQMKSKSKSL